MRDLNEHRQLGNRVSLGLGLTITWLPEVAEKLREPANPDYSYLPPSPPQPPAKSTEILGQGQVHISLL